MKSNVLSTKHRTHPRGWDAGIPPSLRPLVRAYLFGYGFSVGPRVLSLLLHHLLKLSPRRKGTAQDDAAPSGKSQAPLLESLGKILRAGTQLNRFPTFCAALVGSSTLLEVRHDITITAQAFRNGSLLTSVSSWIACSTESIFSTAKEGHQPAGQGSPASPEAIKPQAGRTLDLTLFAATRALDVIIGELWSQRRVVRSPSASRTTRTLDYLTSTLTDPLIFALTSGIVMWNWFYAPHALPRAYNKWIASAASVDQRLIVALQRVRAQIMRYGEDTGQAPLLQGMCEDFGWPTAWGDPAVSVPFPCEMVHMGVGPSCELHALSRFLRAWAWSMRTYLPLQLVMFAARARGSKDLRRDFVRTLTSASRSSAFLGAFIALFYYGVCLTRTRVGPHVLGTSPGARQRIDSGLCVGAGCLLCGWSVLLETAGRRKELGLFVAPRAVATMLPRRYDADRQWMEKMTFAASTAVVFTCVLENKRRVRGVLGSVLRMVLAA
ncbi:hypothetical protein M406DRAFT_89160 [Cryphonectria parasitica EP155]|uniref:Integral membrane protein n=1 Tax=Cryphonectria parasitica (strain ATCC 38755 / EP155) TaxID=660469 RepID=A0A9P4Y487_CRYP1|nr:uncharacterized protein M406DRAFT_89160 [Cryphonectria parasitica EP155]KAF3766351.1 hypothetical protein M406DRAFT_89160 [Cryphonectria parasitica EP155]